MQAKLTPEDAIKERLKEAYDTHYYASIYRQVQIAFGDTIDRESGSASHGVSFPHFPDIVVQNLRAGQSRRILNAAVIHLAKAMMAQPEPRWTQVDKWINEVRTQCYRFRARGTGYADGEWQIQNANAFMWSDAVGVGFLHYEFKVNPKTGRHYLHKRCSPTLHTLWDPHESDPNRAKYVCFVRHIPVDRARAIWGSKIDEYVKDFGSDSSTGAIKAVRIFDYYDLGYEKGTPTRAIIAGEMDGEVLERRENTLGCLPFVALTHILFPGMRRPIGRVVMQVASQEVINELEMRMLEQLRKKTTDVIDVSWFDPDDVEEMLAGKKTTLKIVKPIPRSEKAFDRIPAEPLDVSLLQSLQYYENSFNTDSGTTEYDQGRSPDKIRTAFEASLIQQGAMPAQNWSTKQVTEGYTLDAMKFAKLFAGFDRDPLMVDVFGYNILVNDPERPNSMADVFFAEESLVEIDEASISAVSGDAKRSKQVAELMTIAQAGLLGMTVDPLWFTEQLLRALRHDPREAMGGIAGASEAMAGGQEAAAAQGPTQPQPQGQPAPNK